MADGNGAIQELPFPPQVVTDAELLTRLQGDSVLQRRLLAAGCTCVRIRRVGGGTVIHGFCPESDQRVLHANPKDEQGFWFRVGHSVNPINAPVETTAYRLTVIQHLTDD